MDYIFSVGVFCAFFFAVLLLGKKPKALHDRILMGWLVYLGLALGIYLLSSSALFAGMSHLPAFIVSLFLLHGPFLYLYTTTLTSGQQRLPRSTALHFLPFVAFVLYLLMASQGHDHAAALSLSHEATAEKLPLLFVVLLLLTALSGPIYFIVSIIKVQQYKRNCMDSFSTIEEINLNWLRILLYIFGLIWTLLTVVAVTHHIFHYSSTRFCIDGLYTSLAIFVVLVGYFGLNQREIFTHYQVPENPVEQSAEPASDNKEKYSNISLSTDEMQHYVERLKDYMAMEKPYLNPDLTLPLLAGELNIPNHHLSRVINEQFGQNFFDFINGYRVEEVKRKLFDPALAGFSLLGVAFECGFNSKSAFNRIFKKSTGFTPSEYKKAHPRP
ncbi:MAG: helix-turn-helix transcriptional regulator [Prevotella sp.]|nr:helix-turn-helix transcriptional regulator [Prevotella sp.]